MSERIIALLHGQDKAGIVARVSGWIYARGGNILHADQHRDTHEGIFFQRIEWEPAGNIEEEIQLFEKLNQQDLQMDLSILKSSKKMKIALLASQFEHCFGDILNKSKAGELDCEIVCAISNHKNVEELSKIYGVPFYYTPVSKDNKAEVEKQHLDIIKSHNADLVVLARYMQILSSDFLNKVEKPVINIHHSFLPAFAGAKPYHKAHQRGVKIIGATAHYATEDLDEGPIIEQAVARVSHRNSIEDLMLKGKELERVVLSTAIRWHIQGRILTYKNKTVVFD